MAFANITREELKSSLKKTTPVSLELNNIKLLFVPTHIDPENPEELTSIYKNVCSSHFDTLVVIESYNGELEKKLSIPSNHSFTTPFGEVLVNDKLRNELCDEEDDFYINDGGMSDKMSLYTQLMMLQVCQDDFDVVSIQIGDYDPAIVKELAFALDELFRNRNALLVFCCDLPSSNPAELEKLKSLIESNNESGLHHYLNSKEKEVEGARAFMTGILVSKYWDLDIWFTPVNEKTTYTGGFAHAPIVQPAV
ncbi:MAG: AmmeMemoRadiSam system protein B [Bacteroidetes bacterium]|jgi:AmmeMemoRadiSam system protein B|nr:AmmeMemoRadiSam system protein B [Bacteroidota bacterium]|tara:strand:- start:273 stop:1028 length:756 start_codon:yes stop_codon:yes gene_type:complete